MFRILTILPLLVTCFFAKAQVVANFSADTTKGCTPVTVQFFDASTGPVSSYYWTFGNGNTSTKKDPSAIFYKPGVYTVTLKVTDASGNSDTKTKTSYIEVFELPKADFAPLKTSGCVPLSVPFNNKSTKGSGDIDVVTWDFGDGNTLISNAGFHQYKHEGTYSVSLLVVDKNKCEDKIKKDNIISVWPVPETDFEADETYACSPPLDVQFKNTTGNLSSGDTYVWDFGDGTTSTSKDPKHTYTNSGSYTVKLTITNSKGCTKTKVMNSLINIKPLNVDFDISTLLGCLPLDISFTNKTTPDVSGLTYYWDLGNGKTAQTRNVSMKYENTGTYTISLTVSKGGKCNQKKTYSNAITVKPSPEPKIKLTDSTSCSVPFDVVIEDAGKGSTKWTWLLNENVVNTVRDPKIKITQFGDHVISLVAENNEGCKSDTIKQLISMKPINVSVSPDTMGCVPMSVTFRNTSDLDGKVMATQDWDFGDGTTKTVTDPNQTKVTHTYTSTGTYQVKLKVVTDEGCEGVALTTVKLGDKRPPKIETGLDTLCNSSQGEVLNWTDIKLRDSVDAVIWKLIPKTGKGGITDSSSKDKPPLRWNFKFDVKERDTGYYDVQLITVDRGCRDTAYLEDRIYILPPKAILKPLHDTCANDIMILANVSEYYDSINWQVNKWLHFDSILRVGTDTAKQVLLRAYNSTSKCIDSAEFVFEPKQTFSGGFSYDGDLCAPTNFTFNGSAPESYLSYLWVINGEDSFNSRSLSISFDQPGKYEVSYIATDTSATGGCKRGMQKVFNVTGPTVDGKIEGKPGCGPIDVKLTSYSDPKNFSKLYWKVGSDIYNAIQGTITIELYKPGPNDGVWPIQLIGQDSNGCMGSKSFEIEVYGTKNAELKINRFQDCEGLKYIFSPIFNDPVDDKNWTYKWDMGDGEGKSDLKVVNYVFKKSGKFAVKLYMTDENGCVTRLQDTLDIAQEVLKAKFFADSLIKDCPPLHVQFEDRSTLNGLRKIIKWEWDFGDGTTSRERYPSKLYLKAGSFDVSLKVTDEWGCVDSFTYPGFVLVNGPNGNYVFDKTEGCVPLDVTFEADTSQCTSFTWDFGDGNILKDKLKVTHTYQDTGRFIPLLTLSDRYGCTYTHPPIDTIYVYPLPLPDFNVATPCPGVPTNFVNTSLPTGYLANTSWDFGDGGSSEDRNPVHTYAKGGVYPVKLEVTTREGCTNDTLKYIELKGIDAKFSTAQSEVCVGSSIDIVDRSESDTTLVSWEWIINDTFHYSGPNPEITFDKVGPVKVQLIIEDAIGCRDTLLEQTLLKVGDTIPPVPTGLLRVSVMDDNTYLIDFKESTIPDFRSYYIYHNDGLEAQIYDRKETRFEMHNVNTLHNVYCGKVAVENSCGLVSDFQVDSNDCTVEVSAVGEVNQSRLNWNPYFGWNNVEKYYIYREHLDTPGNYFLLDSVSGNTFEYIDTNILCYATHHYRILASELAGNEQVSWSDTCAATPIYINSLPPNELVRATVQHDDYVRVEWLPTPFSKMPIDHYILEKSFDGIDYRMINSFPSTTFDADDHQVAVDDQSYFYRVRAVDVCDDESPHSNLAKTILLVADTGKFQRPYLYWSKYEGWDVGVDKYEIQRKEPDGSFFSLGYTNSGDDTTFYDKQTSLNERPHFCYRVIGYKVMEDNSEQVISISNEDCIDVHSWLYVPNAFTPNDDGLNDYFVTPGWYIKDYRIRIYNRWGEKLYESESLYRSWEGKYNGEVVENEAYLYIIETTGIDNIKRNYKGTVTVIR